MKQRPIRASEFVTFDEAHKTLLLKFGGVPINDVFFDLWDDESKVLLLYGGYGSGKSVFIVDKLLNSCMNDDYFRCFYGRKIYNDIRGSIFQTLVDRIEERGLQAEFIYSKADNSSMKIHCKSNGNFFSPYGCNDPQSLLSVKDPTHILCEEMNQFSFDDFSLLLSRLRKVGAKKQLIGAFNTTWVKEDHWIKQTLFTESEVLKKLGDFEIKKRFCNYPDNYFLDHKDYEQRLWLSANFNEQKFREIASGDWGSEEKTNTFIYSFRQKEYPDKSPGYCHVIEGMEPDYKLPLILSFDFNVEPITCSVWQHANDLSWISGLQEYRLMNSDIFELCERILTDHPGAFFKITGDASGKSRTAITKGNRNYFQIIKSLLSLNSKQFYLPSKNPFHANTRVLSNLILTKHPAILLNKSMQHLIADINSVEIDEDGSIAKGKDKHKTHLLDTFLYYLWNFHLSFLKKYKRQLPVKDSSVPMSK